MLTLLHVIESGVIGVLYSMECNMVGYGRPGQAWRTHKPVSGGALYDWGAHLVEHAVQIGEAPAWVFCETMRHKWTTDVETYVKCLIKFRSGLFYSVEVGYLAKYSKPKFFALGTEGAFLKEGLDRPEIAPRVVRPEMEHIIRYLDLPPARRGEIRTSAACGTTPASRRCNAPRSMATGSS